MAGGAVPQAIATFERPRTLAAARYLASRMTRARTEAVMRSATIGIRLTPESGTLRIEEFVDANRNGIRTADIASGVDVPRSPGMRLSDQFPRVESELAGSALLSFTPYGTATSRTITLRGADGSRFAVRILGASGRTRVLRFDATSGDWVDVL